MNVKKIFTGFLFLLILNSAFSQNNLIATCQLEDGFTDTHYFVIERSAQISSSDLRKKLVESIINFISVESRLELENIDEYLKEQIKERSL